MGSIFSLQSPFSPMGDQPKAIEKLVEGIQSNKKSMVLLGVTGSGKTFTMAHVIARLNRPTLLMVHNKTLAAQLYEELKTLFPNNAVEYFVSYYDYYQPEAYIARTDTYIEKDLAINDQIDRMRLSATRALLERQDVIIVASVSCIYGLGMPQNYIDMRLVLEIGQDLERDNMLLQLVHMQYERSEDLGRGQFRVRGDVVDIMPAYEQDIAYRVEFFGDEIENIFQIDPLTCQKLKSCEKITLYPASHHVIPEKTHQQAIESIKAELDTQQQFFADHNQLIEQQRIIQRTRYDLEMIGEMGYCKGIENYSRHFDARAPGSAPSCLIDYFPKDFLLIIDESHQTLPQVRAMYNGDRARKQALIDFGFRLPSAYDNRPLKFDEFYQKMNQTIYVSATPGPWEVEDSQNEIVEQIIRPTGLLDPEIDIRPVEGQIDDAIEEIRSCVAHQKRVLVTTLTKKMAEQLSDYLQELGVKAKYLHSEIDTVERVELLQQLRKGAYDVLVGINLLREGLDLPEVGAVLVLDADKEGFLRSTTSLIQICGRAARNHEGRVVMYADKMTQAIKETLEVTNKRRKLQKAYNLEHNIIPRSVTREIGSSWLQETSAKITEEKSLSAVKNLSQIQKMKKDYETAMKKAAKEYRFEDATRFRDLMREYQRLELEWLDCSN